MKLAVLALFFHCSLLHAQRVQDQLGQILESLRNDQSGQLTGIAKSLLGENGGNKLFYYPTRDTPYTPQKYGRKFEDVTFTAVDQTQLSGWFIPSTKASKPLGTVVFSHGNTGSMGYHLGFVNWLSDAGYNVFLYDYRGFGKSGGTPSRSGIISDVVAAFQYVTQRTDVAGGKIFSFGHSLGGAKSIVALAQTKVPNLRGVITDGTFASYQGMAVHLAGNFGKNMVTDELSPKDYVAKLPVPLLMVHGTDDQVVPIEQGRQLFAAAVPRKLFYEVKGGHHGDSLLMNNGAYRKKMLEWMQKY